MTTISMTRFVDFTLKSGATRIASVKITKKQLADDYHPSKDFYKQLRERIQELHYKSEPPAALSSFFKQLTDAKKRTNYGPAIKGYQAFLRKIQKSGTVLFFAPPTQDWAASPSVSVRVNPEIGLNINGVPHIIKLHLKSEKAKKGQFDTSCELLVAALASASSSGTKFCVLDVRNSKLTCLDQSNPITRALLVGDGAAFSSLFSAI